MILRIPMRNVLNINNMSFQNAKELAAVGSQLTNDPSKYVNDVCHPHK